jgi:uncharacterized protein
MDREQIIGILRDHEAELKAEGLLHLRLFGSAARGDNGPESDVDLMADYDESRQITLFTLSRLRLELSDLLGTEVHLSSRRTMYPDVLANALDEAVVAF